MSGIVGLWNLDGQTVEAQLLSRLSATLAHRGPDGEGVWVQGPVGLACQLFRATPESRVETQPLVHHGGAVIVFDGRLDNRAELLGLLQGKRGIGTDSPDPALVLAAYETWGDGFAARLNGDFALGLFDPHRRQLLLARDAIGVRPLYYCRTGNTFLFATEIKAILAYPPISCQPNDDFLAAFLLNQKIPQDLQGLSLFTGVFTLLPAHLVILTPEKLSSRQYWDFDLDRQVRLRSFEEYAETFRQHFEAAVRRRLRSAFPVGVSLSGGLDSSSIFCQAETIRRKAPENFPPLLGLAYTAFDGSLADENAFLKEIEQAYSLTVARLPLGHSGFLKEGREAIRYLEAPVLEEDGNQAFFRAVRQLGPRLLLTGHWGDQFLFEQAYLIDFIKRGAWTQIWPHLSKFPRWFTDASRSAFVKRFRDDLIVHCMPALLPGLRWLRDAMGRGDNLRTWFTKTMQQKARQSAKKNHRDGRGYTSLYAKCLYKQSQTGYAHLYLELTNKLAAMHGLEIAFPFLDRDLIQFLMGIPGEIAAWQGVPKALLREGMKEVLPEAIARRNWKGDLSDLTNQGMAEDFPHLVNWLRPDGMAVQGGYLRRDPLEKLPGLAKRIQGQDCLLTWNLGSLLGLELWLQTFFGRNRD
jgi:asparagine synthase (glutamine-hydrolysing)